MTAVPLAFAVLLAAGSLPGPRLAASGATESAPVTRTPIEIWRGGDDGLTLKFAYALEAAFRASKEFSISSGKQRGTLIVTIPSALEWKRVGDRVRVSYRVTYSDVTNRPLGAAKGKCWEDELDKPAADIVKRAIGLAAAIAVLGANGPQEPVQTSLCSLYENPAAFAGKVVALSIFRWCGEWHHPPTTSSCCRVPVSKFRVRTSTGRGKGKWSRSSAPSTTAWQRSLRTSEPHSPKRSPRDEDLSERSPSEEVPG